MNTIDISARTIKNFLNVGSLKRGSLEKVHTRTLRFVDAYLKVTNKNIAFDLVREDYIARLGQLTAFQYLPEERDSPDTTNATETVSGTYAAHVGNLDLPTPLSVEHIVLSLTPSRDNQFFICHMLCISRDIKFLQSSSDAIDKSDWLQERFSGIATFSRNGIGCHLTGASVSTPIYVLIKNIPKDHGPEPLEKIYAKVSEYSEPTLDELAQDYLCLDRCFNSIIIDFIESYGGLF